MQIFELDQQGGFIVRALRRLREQEQRRSGLHCSTICDDYINTLYPRKSNAAFTLTQTLLFQNLGNTLENMLARELATICEWEKPSPRQDEFGIWCSPDGWSPRIRCIDEVKLTWTSKRDFLSSVKFKRYLLQILKYYREWDAERARLHVVWVAGLYRPAFPDATTYTLKPTTLEVDTNHFNLVQHAIDRGWLHEDALKPLTSFRPH